MALLEIEDLHVEFPSQGAVLHAVDGVSLSLAEGDVLGIVGESGSGKSVSMLALMGLVAWPGRVRARRLEFNGHDLLRLSDRERRRVIGKDIAMIFQEPTTSLNPCFSIGFQLTETLRLHLQLDREAARRRAVELLEQVGIPAAASRLSSFPHQLSGGMNQRVMIAMAIACNPRLLIADEPTTALDVTIQAQILDLMRDIRTKMQASIILITHDLGVVAEMCERVAVMYAGQIVEQSDVQTLFAQPKHPYTQGLIGSIPVLGVIKDKLDVIPGSVPNLINLPVGCRFAPRCRARVQYQLTICADVHPELRPVAPDHQVRCWLYHHSPEHKHVAPRAVSS
jgi:dipeptide transport system ATP-binding protein